MEGIERHKWAIPHGWNLMNGKDNIHEVDKTDDEKRPMTCEIESHEWSWTNDKKIMTGTNFYS